MFGLQQFEFLPQAQRKLKRSRQVIFKRYRCTKETSDQPSLVSKINLLQVAGKYKYLIEYDSREAIQQLVCIQSFERYKHRNDSPEFTLSAIVNHCIRQKNPPQLPRKCRQWYRLLRNIKPGPLPKKLEYAPTNFLKRTGAQAKLHAQHFIYHDIAFARQCLTIGTPINGRATKVKRVGAGTHNAPLNFSNRKTSFDADSELPKLSTSTFEQLPGHERSLQ